MQTRKYTFDGHPIYLLGERGSGARSRRNIQDFYEIRNTCLKAGFLFEDSEFPASDESLFHSRAADKRYEWLRPNEMCEEPRFFVDGFSRFDVRQGQLENCWFLVGVSNLTVNEKIFSRVVCNDNSFEENYAGIFHFRFWRYGKWIDIVIDDRLPTYQGRLLNMHSSEKNEFWSALLEKAYAKLYGSYEALKSGNSCEAFEDFTGGVSEMFELKNLSTKFYGIIQKAFRRNSMMSCSIEPDLNVKEKITPQGLVRGHAYAITNVKIIDVPNRKEKIPLLRLRNPWGDEYEWNGAWSDKSYEWNLIPDYQKIEMGLVFDRDGEFWMSYHDFIAHFDKLDICNLSPDSLLDEVDAGIDKKWNLNVFDGEWIPGVSAGGCRNNLESFDRNPQYMMKLEHPDEDDDEGLCSVVIALMQKNRRSRKIIGFHFLFIGFTIYHICEQDLLQKPLKKEFFENNKSICASEFRNMRGVSGRFKLQPGHYLIVPSTFYPDQEGEFLIRIFSERQHVFEEYDKTVGIGNIDSRISSDFANNQIPSPETLTIEKLFINTAGPSQEIGWLGLKKILDHSVPKEILENKFGNGLDLNGSQNGNNNSHTSHGFSKDICRSIVAMLDFDHSGKLGLEEFRIFLNEYAKWRAVFKLYVNEESHKLNNYELREALGSAGYDLNHHIINSLVYRYGSSEKTISFEDFIMCAVKVKTMLEYFKEKDVWNKNEATFTANEWIMKSLYS